MPININSYNISSYINNTGYGVMSKNLIRSIDDYGINICLFPKNRISEKDELFKTLSNKEFNKFSVSLNIDHQYNLFHHTTSNRVGFTVFELDTFTSIEKNSICSNDIVIVPTKWAKDVIQSQIPSYNNVYVANLGVDRELFSPNIKVEPKNLYRKNPETFIIYFGGKYERRKSVDEIIAAFNKAFDYKDNVELWLSVFNPFLTNEEMENAHNKILSPAFNKLWSKTKIIGWLPTQNDVAQVMSQVSCGLFLARAEGWNLEAIELLSLKKPVILSNYSGHTEFVQDGCFLIDCPEVEPAFDGRWFFNQGNWAKIGDKQVNQAADYLQYLYTTKPTDLVKDDNINKFSWKNSAEQAITSINNYYA